MLVIFYLLFLEFIGAFHLICWCVRRFLCRNEAPSQYKRNLDRYIKWVGIWLVTWFIFLLVEKHADIENLGLNFTATAGVFPFYYWKNIFWLRLKKRFKRT